MSKALEQLCFDKMRQYFNGDTERTWMWFKTPNSALGMVSPIDAMRSGRTKQLFKVIDSRLKGYFP
jgi:hypothetical protein